MRYRNFMLAVTALSLVFLSSSYSTAAGQRRTATTTLAGYNVNPTVTTPATGSVTVTVVGDSLFVEGSFSDLNSQYRGSGIYYGDAGENGNQVIKLNSTLNEDWSGGRFSRSENRYKLTPTLRQAFRDGLLYVNIYTQLNPRGEIRGQIPGRQE